MRSRKRKKRNQRTRNRGWQVEKLEDRVLLAGDLEFRSFDGSGNNEGNNDWGAANTQLLRLTTVEYGHGMSGDFPALAERVDSEGNTINPRTVSNLVFDQDVSILNDRGLTSFVFQWGQFLDHDMDLTEDFPPVGVAELDGEDIRIEVPAGDSELPPEVTFIPQLRSRFALDDDFIAQQINQITSYIDASNVYGSSAERAGNLRAGFGGFLRTSDGVMNVDDGTGEFLPFNFEVDGEFLENASPPTTGTGVPIEPDDLFVAGDVRSNEQPGLTTMHTLFVREHNYQARRIAAALDLDAEDLARPEVDEYVYQLARAMVGAEVQSITYNEFLPSLFGPDQLESYRGYQDDINASIANIFSAALYRIGHTMLPNELLLLRENGTPVPDDPDVLGAAVINGQVALGQAFFNPQLITQFGIEPYLKGLAEQRIQEIDNFIVDGVRNLLFDPPAAIDLGATNLQRGRDHGLADYNQTRIDFGLTPVSDFSQISSDPALAAALATAYDGNVDNIDVFAAAISEDHLAGGSVGELMHTVLVNQFTRLRDGDRFYFENVFHGQALAKIQNTRLSDIIRRNTGLQNVQDEVFRAENVLTFRAAEGHGSASLTLRVQGNNLQVVDRNHDDRVVAKQNLNKTDIVVIYGTSKKDTIRVDGSVAAAFSGSVELHGGGGSDKLVVEGTDAGDEIVIAPTEVRVNDLSIYYGNFEKVDVLAAGGDVGASVAGQLDVDLIIAGGLGSDILVGGAGGDLLLGNSGDDILVAGETDADLAAVHDIWTSDLSYSERVAALNGQITSADDGAIDLLFGGFGQDWFLLNGLDVAVDRLFGERVDRG